MRQTFQVLVFSWDLLIMTKLQNVNYTYSIFFGTVLFIERATVDGYNGNVAYFLSDTCDGLKKAKRRENVINPSTSGC